MSTTNQEISIDLANELLVYQQYTGDLFWRDMSGNKTRGAIGTLNKHGYLMLTIGGKLERADRLAWLLFYGELPKHQLEHINGVYSDNRIDNLREE